jgi:predicted RNA-binding protein associated with RNAse of E/G family
MRQALAQISSGEWQQNPHLTEYRSQLLDKMFVERGRWRASAPTHRLGNIVIMDPGYVWVRFWLLDGEEVVEKYFDRERNLIGFFVPICMPVQRRGASFVARTLLLGLWLQADGRLTVLGESSFEAAAASGELAPVEVEHAEFRIRALTLEINQKRYPPGMVRTFGLADEYRG